MRGCFSERGDGTETREEAYSLREPHTPKLEFPRSKVKEFKGVLYSSSWWYAWVGSWVWRCWVVGSLGSWKLEAGPGTWVCVLRKLRLREFGVREFGVWGFGFFLFDFIY